MPHSARYGAFDATAVLPGDRVGHEGARVRHAARPHSLPASASTRAEARDARFHGDFGHAHAHRRRVGHRLPARCGRARCALCAECCRATSALPPHLAEALGRRRRQVALAQPRPHRRRRSSGRARCASSRHRPRAPLPPPSVRPFRKSADASSPTRRRGTPASPAGSALARLGLLDVRAQFQQHLGNVDLHRTDFARTRRTGSTRTAAPARASRP